MRAIDILKTFESTLKVLVKNGVNIADVEHIEMYMDYKRLASEGHKKTYIVSYLEEQYNCPVPTIYRVVKRMEKTLKI